MRTLPLSNEQIPNEQNDFLVPFNRNWAIFLISVLGLFVEMLLIRWIGTEIRIFAYLQNTILIVCFLGLGLGCFTCRKPIRLHQSLVPLIILVLVMAIPIARMGLGKISELLSVLGDLVIWGYVPATSTLWTILSVVAGLIGTYCVMVLVVDFFVPIGRILGRLIDDHPKTILAYSINIAGSLVGTWFFVILSFFFLPPIWWFILFAVIIVIFIIWTRRNWKINLSLLVGVLVLAWFAGQVPGALKVIWSPYQKLVVSDSERNSSGFGNLVVSVNNTIYQMITDLRQTSVSSDSDVYPPEMNGLSQYDIPLLLHPNPKSFLIVGAGAGNDAAAGLRHGIKEITAVDIDPAIIDIGRTFHPENPYASDQVHVIIDDARSFFATTSQKFDVISFGLLDSHTTTSMTNARLDSYVYTKESVQRAKSLLANGGILVLTFEAQKTFISDRMERVLEDVFGEAPIYFQIPTSGYGWGGVMFIAGDLGSVRQQIDRNSRLNHFINTMQEILPISLPHTTRIATDDWPYIYLQSPKVPVLYYLLTGLTILILVRSLQRWQAKDIISRWKRSHWHFFFLGAAFLLLEVQNISKASVILGNTWYVNAVIVSGVLIMALIANWLAYKFTKVRVRYVYIALILTCVILYFVDIARFAFLAYGLKAIVVGTLTTLPMIFSGFIFIRSFAVVVGKDEALGANLIGSLFGALLQSVTFVVGIKALLLVVVGLYILSMITRPVVVMQDMGLSQTFTEQS